MALWRKYGLLAPRFLNARIGDPRYFTLPREVRFRMALDESRGLLRVFGRFLAGRADLLSHAHLRQLRNLYMPEIHSSGPLVAKELGGAISDLRPLRVSPASETYSARHKGSPIVVEVFPMDSEPTAERAWQAFLREIRLLDDATEARITSPKVLGKFREWLQLQRDIERKRTIILNLTHIPSGSIVRFPHLIPELQRPHCLVYEGMDGTDIAGHNTESMDAPDLENLRLLIEGGLEQALLLSLIDADASVENLIVLKDRRLGFRSLPAFSPVPLEWSYELLQYMTSTVAGNNPRALHMLARMSTSEDAYAAEQYLMRELSGLQPELKINVVTPQSVTSLENCWRALANTRMETPLFLELFHRQCTLFGQYNGDVDPSSDLIAESLGPVIGRILRFRFGEMLSIEKGRELATTSGLMMLTALRQLGMTLEQARDNDLALVVEQQQPQPHDETQNRRTASIIKSGLALAAFLIALRLYLGSTEGNLHVFYGIAAGVSAALLPIFVARID